jgi:hypothetical protein
MGWSSNFQGPLLAQKHENSEVKKKKAPEETFLAPVMVGSLRRGFSPTWSTSWETGLSHFELEEVVWTRG